MNKTQFEDFISRGRLDKDGKPIFMTSAELKALNDLCRSEILTLRAGKTSAVKPAATAPVAATPAVKPATVAAKPTPAAPARTVTAADYLASIAKPEITRAEFDKIPHGQRGDALKRYKLVP